MSNSPELLSRPARARREARQALPAARAAPTPPPSLTVCGVLAALNAAGLGLLAVTVLVLVGWASAADSDGSATRALGTALAVWLVGHGTELVLPQGRFGIVPLGLTALLAVLLFVSAARASRTARIRTGRGVAALASVLSATYAVVAVVIAYLATGETARPVASSAFVGAASLALLAGGAGAAHGTGRQGALWRRLPLTLRLGSWGAAGALATLGVGASLLCALMLTRHQGRATTLAEGLDAGIAGGLLLLMLGVLYAPTAVVWATAYVLGPGFSVGSGTSVSMAGVDLGAVPAFPLLAALPGDGPGGMPGYLTLVVPLAAGLVGGLLVDRADRGRPGETRSWQRVGQLAASTGGVTGVALALLAALASGPGGPGRLADVGPSAALVALAGAVEIGVGAALTLAVLRLRVRA